MRGLQRHLLRAGACTCPPTWRVLKRTRAAPRRERAQILRHGSPPPPSPPFLDPQQ